MFDTVKPLSGANGYVFPDAGAYLFQNSAGLRVIDNVANTSLMGNGTKCEVNISLSTTGTRTVEFLTTNQTKAKKYIIRVEQVFPIAGTANTNAGLIRSDEVDVIVEEAAVTIVARGDQAYAIGEEIMFFGTNTGTSKTYLFITGPGLPENGAEIFRQNPRNYPVRDNDANSFPIADVLSDNTWSWKWRTADSALDAGTYTIYAVSAPRDKKNLGQAEYGTVSIIIEKPRIAPGGS